MLVCCTSSPSESTVCLLVTGFSLGVCILGQRCPVNSPVAVTQLLSASKANDCVCRLQQFCQTSLQRPKQAL